MSNKDTTFNVYVGALIAIVLCFIGLIWFVESHKPKKGEVPTTTLVLYGEVVDIYSCQSSKHSLNCRIAIIKNGQTSTYRMDVTDYPGDNVQKGDVLGIQTRQYAKSRETGRYRNGRVRTSGVCYKFMPCWGEVP